MASTSLVHPFRLRRKDENTPFKKQLLTRRSRTQSVETLQSVPSSNCCESDEHHQPEAASSSTATTTNNNGHALLFQWLETDCPADGVLPLILAFLRPQQTAALSRTSRHWNRVMRSEATWRVLCEQLYKVRLLLCEQAYFAVFLNHTVTLNGSYYGIGKGSNVI